MSELGVSPFETRHCIDDGPRFVDDGWGERVLEKVGMLFCLMMSLSLAAYRRSFRISALRDDV